MNKQMNYRCDEKDIVIRPVNAVAVYPDGRHDVVIRQLNLGGSDSCVLIPRERVADVVRALRRSTRKNKAPLLVVRVSTGGGTRRRD